MADIKNKLKGVDISWNYTWRDSHNYYVVSENESRDFWIINEIFQSVIEKKQKKLTHIDDWTHIHQIDKIKLNFQDISEQNEIIEYFKYAYLKISLIEIRIREEVNYVQLDIQSEIFSYYSDLKREGKKNYL